jgi:type I restriction enzyme S subunit
LTEIRREFNARFWEMYLTCALLERASEFGYSLSCPKRKDGCPDILLELKGERIWIEAVAATNGEAGRPDSLVEPRIPTIVVGDRADEQQEMDLPIEPGAAESGKIPEGKIVLRYTTAIREKYMKYLHYRRKGIVRKDDAYVVAVNKSGLAYRWASAAIDLPRFLKAVYPIGELEVLIDKKARKVVGAQNRPRFFIPTSGDTQNRPMRDV